MRRWNFIVFLCLCRCHNVIAQPNKIRIKLPTNCTYNMQISGDIKNPFFRLARIFHIFVMEMVIQWMNLSPNDKYTRVSILNFEFNGSAHTATGYNVCHQWKDLYTLFARWLAIVLINNIYHVSLTPLTNLKCKSGEREKIWKNLLNQQLRTSNYYRKEIVIANPQTNQINGC